MKSNNPGPLTLFTDGSVDPKTKKGVGAFLVLKDIPTVLDGLSARVKTRVFENTSSTRLELETVLWALEVVGSSTQTFSVVTDSQMLVGLPSRRSKLEKTGFRSSQKRLLSNAHLYKELFAVANRHNLTFVKVKGHKKKTDKKTIESIFSLVDQLARKKLKDLRK